MRRCAPPRAPPPPRRPPRHRPRRWRAPAHRWRRVSTPGCHSAPPRVRSLGGGCGGARRERIETGRTPRRIGRARPAADGTAATGGRVALHQPAAGAPSAGRRAAHALGHALGRGVPGRAAGSGRRALPLYNYECRAKEIPCLSHERTGASYAAVRAPAVAHRRLKLSLALWKLDGIESVRKQRTGQTSRSAYGAGCIGAIGGLGPHPAAQDAPVPRCIKPCRSIVEGTPATICCPPHEHRGNLRFVCVRVAFERFIGNRYEKVGACTPRSHPPSMGPLALLLVRGPMHPPTTVAQHTTKFTSVDPTRLQ